MHPSQETSPAGRFRRLLGGVAIIGALAAAGSIATGHYFHAAQATATGAAAEQAVPVTVALIEPKQTVLWDDFSGRLEAIQRVELRPRVAGAILSTNFTEGALVKAGDVLFKIDPAPYEAEVDKAAAQLEAAKARVVFTKSELDRGAQLVGNAVVTRRDYDQRDNANREAIANVKAAEATLQTAKLNLDYTEVRAPVDGRVGKIEITIGNLVAAGTASPVLTSLVSVNPIYASFDADEEVVLRALNSIADSTGRRGNLDQIPVEMTTSGALSAKGHIQLIDNQVNGQSGTIRVRAVFPNDDGRLIPGQFARVRMGQPKQQTLVMIDERAIGTDQDKKFVMAVGDDSRAVYRPITLGGAVDGLRIVTAGLKPGDRIVVNGLQRVRPGALLKTEVAAMGARGQQASNHSNQDVVQR
ncbi:efflux RND transporter periplasmic adaptor subunit [Bradyrhizobium guangdongense]|uniref:Efflux transporter periplasmic adaptor subunit n=1 Tax=Bradyrhizobium guangdongense TaxID=1325090 RepID=A0A410V9U2_9BRAD|nr:efflux RND transporter periplasmic adaptor subunit [Bradyrhizobium guangdongense]QAU40380.1 efflux transporter periplasmic adaptor subunit [Bradyrhizobium guangdongense]QOZ61444.1 efflux transporter periplasmic adaptor subunit [Bradyrhizobium guangdongense]GGI22634.1 MexE family multidrug efflux RND transporter periplasmic adaptor subunit [Bradyrhizobium guangdongense]